MKKDLALIKLAKSFIGQEIINVWYEGKLDITEEFHSIEKAFYIETNETKVYKVCPADKLGIKWGHGIHIKEIKNWHKLSPNIDDLLNYKNIPYKGFYNSQVVKSSIHWRYIEESVSLLWKYPPRSDYPQSLELILSDGSQIIIEVARILPDDKIVLGTNSLVLFFDITIKDTYFRNVQKRGY